MPPNPWVRWGESARIVTRVPAGFAGVLETLPVQIVNVRLEPPRSWSVAIFPGSVEGISVGAGEDVNVDVLATIGVGSATVPVPVVIGPFSTAWNPEFHTFALEAFQAQVRARFIVVAGPGREVAATISILAAPQFPPMELVQ